MQAEWFGELAQYLNCTRETCMEVVQKTDINRQWENRTSDYDFYNQTDFYLYDLTNYSNDRGRLIFKEQLRQFIKDKGLKIGLDYGCGIGTDVITMFEAGIEHVYGMDIYSACMNYMVWRLERRNIKKPFQFMPILPTGHGGHFPTCDIAICIAVLEHLHNPREVLKGLVGCCRYLVLRVDPTNPHDAHPMHIEKNFPFLIDVDRGKPELLAELGLRKINNITTMPLFEILK